MIILLDCDGVLADLLTPWAGLLGLPRGYEPRTYDLSCSDLHSDKIARALNMVCESADMLSPYSGVIEELERLRTEHEVVCVTAMHSRKRYRWLQRELGFAKSDIVSTQAKQRVPGDIFVDDHPAQVHAWCQAHPNSLGYVFARSYNRGDRLELPRIQSLAELAPWID